MSAFPPGKKYFILLTLFCVNYFASFWKINFIENIVGFINFMKLGVILTKDTIKNIINYTISFKDNFVNFMKSTIKLDCKFA